MTVTTQEFCDVLRDRAAAVHELVTFSYAQGLGVSEEAITDMLAVEIRRRLPANHVFTRKFTRHEESSVSGADWLWVIGKPGKWLAILVQAKLARPGQASLRSLHHKNGAQRKMLVQHARAKKYIPLYVIYTGFTGDTSATSKTKSHQPLSWTPACPQALDPGQMGCVAVRPSQIARMHQSRKLRTSVVRLINAGNPLACLFCCPGSTGTDDLAAQALAGIKRLSLYDAQLTPFLVNETKGLVDDIYDLGEGLIFQSLPDIARVAVEGSQLESLSPFSKVTVISSEPLDR